MILAHIEGTMHVHPEDVILIIVAAMVTTVVIGLYRKFVEGRNN